MRLNPDCSSNPFGDDFDEEEDFPPGGSGGAGSPHHHDDDAHSADHHSDTGSQSSHQSAQGGGGASVAIGYAGVAELKAGDHGRVNGSGTQGEAVAMGGAVPGGVELEGEILGGGKGVPVKAVFDYAGVDVDELSFKAGKGIRELCDFAKFALCVLLYLLVLHSIIYNKVFVIV